MNTKKRVGIYLRVSTSDQSNQLQAREIEAYTSARSWQITQIYEDQATGTNSNRPALKRLLEDARERRLDTVIVWKLDRFARSLKDLILMLQELGDLGIEFISLKDSLDLSTSAGKLMLHIIGAFAQFEADIIRERVNAGIANARSKGQKLGRPTRIDASRVITLRNEGWSLGKIAKQLGASKTAVHKILSKNPGTKPFIKSDFIHTEKSSTKL